MSLFGNVKISLFIWCFEIGCIQSLLISNNGNKTKFLVCILGCGRIILSVKIILPHPRMHKRNFVLFPLFELNKDWKHPTLKCKIKKLISSLSNSDIRSIKQI